MDADALKDTLHQSLQDRVVYLRQEVKLYNHYHLSSVRPGVRLPKEIRLERVTRQEGNVIGR